MTRLIFLMLISFALWSCKNDNDIADSELVSGSAVSFSAQCQTHTIEFRTEGKWAVSTDCDWITPDVKEGTGNGTVNVYIQQNDGDGIRMDSLFINTNNGKRLKVVFTQNVFDTNSGAEVDLPQNFGLGWGYDYTTDHADVKGLRGQVFDGQALKNDFGEDAVISENQTSTHIYYASAKSVESLQKNMRMEVAGKVDFLIAGARVSAEFSKQTDEQKECLMIWSRDCKYVKQAYFSNDVDLYDPDVALFCTTAEFRKSVRNDSPEDFVKKYGTHLIVNSSLGGKLDYYFSVKSDVTTETSAIVTTVTAKFLFWNKTWTAKEEKVWQEVKSEFEGNFYVTGGGEYEQKLNSEFKYCLANGVPLENTELLDKWQSCFVNADTAKDKDLTMIDFRVVPIWEIVYCINETKADEIKNYIESVYNKKNLK